MNKHHTKPINMLHRIVFTLICCMAACLSQAQNSCIIKGYVAKDTLLRSNQLLKKVFLSKIDEYDRLITVDSANVRNHHFEFTRTIAPGEPVLMYFITGFENGQTQLFLEPGTVNITIPNAGYPAGGTAAGTVTNDLYNNYKAISERCIKAQTDTLKILTKTKGDKWLDSKEGTAAWLRIGAVEVLRCNADRLQFLLEHNNSPLAPLMMEKEIYYQFDKEYADNLLSALSPDLKNHPYYRSFSNLVKSLNLKTGAELPDITIPLADGKKTTLSQYRGKYILLDFWASWCGPCRKEIPNLVQLFNDTQDKRDKFTIVSFSLDNKEKAWKDAIVSLGMNKDGWIHGSDLLAWGSPAAKMLGVEAIPKAILIDPEGRAISFSLRGEALIRRIKQILGGDLYYQKTGDEDSNNEKMKAIHSLENQKK